MIYNLYKNLITSILVIFNTGLFYPEDSSLLFSTFLNTTTPARLLCHSWTVGRRIPRLFRCSKCSWHQSCPRRACRHFRAPWRWCLSALARWSRLGATEQTKTMQSWTRAAAAAAHFPDFPAQMVPAQQAGLRRSRAGSVWLAGWCRQAGRAIGRQQDKVGNGPCENNIDFRGSVD